MFALNDVSLSIPPGQSVGIIGDNGSGKSTLLKIISGISHPSDGEISVVGRVGSLIELGAGFLPDLTGEESIFLNAALMGFKKEEVLQLYESIIEYAGIGSFIKQPIRTYSSGMVVRLGFSIAIHLEPDILLVDEVLAVGDHEFQQKSFKSMKQFRSRGLTTLLVSHDLNLVERYAERIVVLHQGKVMFDGDATQAVKYYLAQTGPVSNNPQSYV